MSSTVIMLQEQCFWNNW